MEKKKSFQAGEASEKTCSPTDNAGPLDDGSCQRASSETYVATCQSVYSETYVATCRVCQCIEPDSKGNNALGFLGISPPSCCIINGDEVKSILKVRPGEPVNGSQLRLNSKGSELVEFISPTGEILVCTADLESGLYDDQDKLIELGCACKNDLAVAHYACALRWFINHGSTVCEICGSTAKNIRLADFKKVLRCLKDYDALRERILNGDPSPAPVRTDIGIDPDAVAAIRSQRLSEIALWFNPHNHSVITPLVVSEQPQTSNIVQDEITHVENRVTKWAVESTGILLATGLLTVTLAWLLAPHVGKRTAKMGLHILLGGLCALTVVIFFRFFVLTRIKYGPARYWAILFVFWFLVFGIWASRTHGAHST